MNPLLTESPNKTEVDTIVNLWPSSPRRSVEAASMNIALRFLIQKSPNFSLEFMTITHQHHQFPQSKPVHSTPAFRVEHLCPYTLPSLLYNGPFSTSGEGLISTRNVTYSFSPEVLPDPLSCCGILCPPHRTPLMLPCIRPRLSNSLGTRGLSP